MEFILVIIEVLACFILGSLLLRPGIRKLFPTTSIGLLFYLEGLWAMANYIIGSIWPANHVMDIIKYCFTLLIAVLLIFTMIKLSDKGKKRKSAPVAKKSVKREIVRNSDMREYEDMPEDEDGLLL